MKQKPRWTLEIFTVGFAVLAGLLALLVLMVQPAAWPAVLLAAVLCIVLVGVSRYRVRRWAARWVTGTSFENSRTQYSLASLSQPAALLAGDTVVWYNIPFRESWPSAAPPKARCWPAPAGCGASTPPPWAAGTGRTRPAS